MRKDPKDQTWKIAPKNVDLTAERLENESPYLPTFKKVEAIPLVTWASHTGEEFYHEINGVYETMVHWQKKSFYDTIWKGRKRIYHRVVIIA